LSYFGETFICSALALPFVARVFLCGFAAFNQLEGEAVALIDKPGIGSLARTHFFLLLCSAKKDRLIGCISTLSTLSLFTSSIAFDPGRSSEREKKKV